MPHDVLVALVSYNSRHVIGDLLDSLPEAMGEITYRTVVVDNGSSDGSADVLRARGDCTVVEQANLGYSAGINRAVSEVPGAEPVLVLNPDVRLRPGAVGALLRALRTPGTGIVVPRVLDDDGELVHSMRREPTIMRATGLNWTGLPWLSEYVTARSAYERPGTCDWAVGAVMLVAREVHDSLGGWDESYFLYSEETDLCLAARDRGWVTRYEPSAVAVHIGGQSGYSAWIHTMQMVNRVRLYGRRHTPAAALVYLAVSVLSQLSWLARGHRDSWVAIRGLLVPRSRPAQLRAGDHLIPR